MSTSKNTRTSVDSGSPVPTQNHSPDKPFYSLDTFYDTLLSRTFKSNTEAIIFCRDLCSNHGFTVKQEQSTHKNIYVYCSREGLPDSHRNPKVNPQRNRQSQRCECRWRIVLFENNQETWEFRKSQNADAFIHNHPLLKPDEIKKEWPREVSEKIFELARQRLPTNEIRQRVREQYPDISWDDRRFYNRLSEERQKMKQRDTALRAIRLVNLSAQICMVNAGSEDLSHYVENKLLALLEDTCKFANVNSNSMTMPVPMPFATLGDPVTALTTTLANPSSFSVLHEEIDNRLKRASMSSASKREEKSNSNSPTNSGSSKKTEESISQDIQRPSAINQKKSFETIPKGFLAVPIPEHALHVKMYSQNSVGDIRRAIFDMQRPSNPNPMLQYSAQHHREPRRRRSRALFAPEEDNDESMDLDTPARKLSRQIASSIMDDELDDMSTQSSPSNSQTMMFTPSITTNTPNDINLEQQQLMHTQYNSSTPNRIAPTSSATGPNLFYNQDGSMSVAAAAAAAAAAAHSGNFITSHHQPSFSPQVDNVYPTISANNSGNSRQQQQQQQQQQQLPQHMIYDPSFMNQPPVRSPSINHQQERPHSVTFGASIPTVMRAQSISMPRGPPIEQQPIVRPTAYPSTFSQLQNIMDENDGKQRYNTFRDPLQQQQHPSRPSSVTGLPSSSSSQMMQQFVSSTQPQQQPDEQNHDMFTSYQLENASQQTNVFPTTSYITDEQLLQQQQQHQQQQQQKRAQQQQQQYAINFRHQQDQHMYRRASGPN
ncbi:hypothetical protein BD408DRAFT_424310 [Parasitella parasitica]|nr:hypothetical protein BD408DRAFT_424310 [Parasitella parasitica]